MQKKVEDIIEAFENYRFEDSLRQIDQLMKKVSKDTKKKGGLSDNDNRMIQIIKCGSLASIGKIHEANHIIESFFTEKILAEMPDKEKFLFCSICELAYDQKIMGKIDFFNKNSKGDVRLQRFMLSHRLFSQVAKIFLKEFVTEKKQEDGLAQIFLEYLNELNKLQPLQNYFAKDMTISHHKELNLKMVELFLMKYLSGINFSKLTSQKLKQSIIDLRLRLVINSNKIQEAKKMYLEFSKQMKDNFVYLRSVRDAGLEGQTQGNQRFYIEQCGLMFRRNLKIEQYVPMYDYYDEFLEFVLSERVTKELKRFEDIFGQQSQPQLKNQQLYNFKEIGNEKVVLHYYLSLVTELKLLTEGQLGDKAKKNDYYKISIKGLLLQILKIHFELAYRITGSQQKAASLLTQSKTFNKYLQIYHNQFAKTLTYVNEMKAYLKFLKPKFQGIMSYVTFQKNFIKLPNVFGRQDDDLILLINGVKLLVVENAEKLHQMTQASYWISLCWQFYEKFINQVEHMKRRQKGEVFLSDEFIIILSDIVTFHIENTQNSETQQTQQLIESLLLKLSCILQQATEDSPYNGNLKLRLLYVCQKLNYFDKLIDTFLSLDIKSVQFQTLGYFIVNPINSFNLYSQLEYHLTRMIRSYQENHRQTSQYCLKGLKAGTILQVLEYFSYQKRLTNSFSKMQLLYTLFNKYHNKEHAQFYLNWIERQLTSINKQSKKISFNCDAKTMTNNIILLSQNQINSGSSIDPYNEFYGHLNSPQMFMFEVNLRKLEILLKSAAENKTNQSQKLFGQKLAQVEVFFTALSKQLNLNSLLDIEQNFSLNEDYLTKKTKKSTKNQNETFTFNKIKKELHFYLKLVQIRLSFFHSAKNILTLLRQSEDNETLIISSKEKFTFVFKNIENSIIFFDSKMLWREQVKNCWTLRQTLFTINHLSRHLNEEAGKLKKIPKPIKSVITEFSSELQKTVLANVTQLKFTENLKSDSTLLNVNVNEKYMLKTSERDQMLRRTCTMDLKEAKNYLNS